MARRWGVAEENMGWGRWCTFFFSKKGHYTACLEPEILLYYVYIASFSNEERKRDEKLEREAIIAGAVSGQYEEDLMYEC